MQKSVLRMNDKVLGEIWDELERELFTPAEIAYNNLRVTLIKELITAGARDE